MNQHTLPTPGISQPLHFHACLDTHTKRPDAGQRVWTVEEVQALFDLSFSDLMFQAQTVHRTHFDPNLVELATLLSVKTGGCPEDCAYCPQSVHFDTGVEASKLMGVEAVRSAAQRWPPRPPGRHGFAWVQPGARPKTATLKPWPNW